MKALIISQYYSPDITAAAFRIAETAKLLKEKGVDVTVLTAKAHRAKVGSGNVDRVDQEGPLVIRCSIRPIGNGGALGYVLHYFSFVFFACFRILRMAVSGYRPDVIWCSSPPLFVGIIGIIGSVFLRTKVIFDIRDIWPESAVAAGLLVDKSFPFKCGKILEKTIYKRAAELTCVASPMANYLTERSSAPVSVVYNGISESEIPQEGAKRISVEDRIKTLLYIGNLGRVQGLDMLIRAFVKNCNERGSISQWRLKIVGGGAVRSQLLDIVDELEADNIIELCEPVPKSEALAEINQANALFLSLIEDPIFRLTIPSKVFDYLAAGCPIVGVFPGQGTEILGETGANVVRGISDQENFDSAIKSLFDEYDSLSERSSRNRELVRNSYTREKATEVLYERLRFVTSQ